MTQLLLCYQILCLWPLQKKKELEKVVTDFNEIWNLAHVVRVIDGKHMRVQCLKIMDAVITITITMLITIMVFSA